MTYEYGVYSAKTKDGYELNVSSRIDDRFGDPDERRVVIEAELYNPSGNLVTKPYIESQTDERLRKENNRSQLESMQKEHIENSLREIIEETNKWIKKKEKINKQ